jgi:hypothetical protein
MSADQPAVIRKCSSVMLNAKSNRWLQCVRADHPDRDSRVVLSRGLSPTGIGPGYLVSRTPTRRSSCEQGTEAVPWEPWQVTQWTTGG